jgi:DNA (cytosine-5)-methyltransferase 1
MRRIAKGVKREVLDRAEPFIVPIANWSSETVQPVDQPLNTITAWPRGGSFAIASPVLTPFYGGERKGNRAHGTHEPLRTQTTENRFALVTAFMAQANGGFNVTHSKPLDAPTTTITNTGSQQQLVTANLLHLRGNCDARSVDAPLHTISAGGQHHGLVTAFLSRQFGASVGQAADDPAPTITAGGMGKTSLVELQLSPEIEEGALRCAAFLINYYGNGDARTLGAPADTLTTRDRLALVTVWISGDPYVIVDIHLRMLQPHELYAAQGFPSNYIIDRGHDGRKLTKSEQVHMCGNSVSPPPMAAIARANNPYRVEIAQGVAA